MSSDVREDDKIVDGFSVSVIWPLAVAASGDAGWPDHRGENIVVEKNEERKDLPKTVILELELNLLLTTTTEIFSCRFISSRRSKKGDNK